MTIAISSRSPEREEAGALPGFAPLRAPLPLGQGSDDIALFLDFDGTLVEIADHPEDVIVPTGLPKLLLALNEELEGRLALVSGRALKTLDRLLDGVDVAMAGSHGGEFRPAGTKETQALAAPLPQPICQALQDFAQEQGGLVFEAKPFSAAIHYRDRPALGDTIYAFATALAADNGLIVKHGKMVVELTMPGSDKGHAVTRFMQQAPFLGSRPLFLGDDVTDEDAFAALAPFGGSGILVGPPRDTCATWRLEDVGAVHRWLEDAI
ncbi:trehalose 6-phosphate phosphatase [Novosphingobium fluoreni]|uniref:Trehalose 6-phosphate phosphatase n=1 Tax=Novosphingobium fluoreni TaxID=1391222 RepID=A0A7W6FZ11_9SPHN|nr:trehalose-phosphatase [Novosphingobium fluoreni]MBB3940575.1 trehalose 6-phosphate phosphatase [Novosphingobium fluoreni]